MKETTNLVFFYNRNSMDLNIPDKLLSIDYIKELLLESEDAVDFDELFSNTGIENSFKNKLELLKNQTFSILGFSIDTNFKKNSITHVFYISIKDKN